METSWGAHTLQLDATRASLRALEAELFQLSNLEDLQNQTYKLVFASENQGFLHGMTRFDCGGLLYNILFSCDVTSSSRARQIAWEVTTPSQSSRMSCQCAGSYLCLQGKALTIKPEKKTNAALLNFNFRRFPNIEGSTAWCTADENPVTSPNLRNVEPQLSVTSATINWIWKFLMWHRL